MNKYFGAIAMAACIASALCSCNDKTYSTTDYSAEPYRVALSLSPFSLRQFEQEYSFSVGDRTASTPQELQQIYRDLGATEMFVRIATKRHVTAEDITYGKVDINANIHTFDQGLQLCRIAAELGMSINPEIMCAYTYMDMMEQQAPRFEEYPEIFALQQGKPWSELSLDEICNVLEAYGTMVGDSILATGCEVRNWNLGNEANYGFAGIGVGLKNAVNPDLETTSDAIKYTAPMLYVSWLEDNIWQYEAKALAALKKGILKAYDKLGIETADVRFSTHIATVVATPKSAAAFFNTLRDNGYQVDVAGISYYPSAPAMSDKATLLANTVAAINQECGLPVFIAEFAYPSGEMDGPFAGWNEVLEGYDQTPEGQARIYDDLLSQGGKNGVIGIRYWAPDYEGWSSMAAFEFTDKHGIAKPILTKSYKTHE